MAPVTEIAILPLIADANPEQEGSPAHKVWHELLGTPSKQPGFQRLYWGRHAESPQMVTLLVDWDSIEAHKAFQASPIYSSVVDLFGEILSGPAQIHHVSRTPHSPAPALSSTHSPVTECLKLYFPTDFDTSPFDSAWIIFHKALEEKAEGFKAASAGWVIEELDHEGEKCKAWAGFIGWDSIDAHMKYRETEAFKSTIGGLRSGTKTIKMNHAVLKEM